MSAEANPIEYWTPPPPAHATGREQRQGQAVSMFTGPERVGWRTMLVVVIVASALAFGIVIGLGWVLA
jgi:hypothetical protein